MMTKCVWLWETLDKPTLLARFWLYSEDRVQAEFLVAGFEEEVRESGIEVPMAWDRGPAFMEEGRVFFDALDTAFRHLTFVTTDP